MRELTPQEFGLSLAEEGTSTQVPTSHIVLSGSATDSKVDGAILEAAIAWQNQYLVFTTDDVPHEDTLNILLLDEHLDLVDFARVGSMYATGSFSLLQILEPNRIGFRFFRDTDWWVTIVDHPVMRLPWISEPRGVSRMHFFKRFFMISQ